MIKFSREKVLLLHQMLIAETGGAVEVRDIGLLESALEGAYATFDGRELYPTKQPLCEGPAGYPLTRDRDRTNDQAPPSSGRNEIMG